MVRDFPERKYQDIDMIYKRLGSPTAILLLILFETFELHIYQNLIAINM